MDNEEIKKEIIWFEKKLEEKEQELQICESAYNEMIAKYRNSQGRVKQVEEMNGKVAQSLSEAKKMLEEAKAEILVLKKEIEALTAPPNAYGFLVRVVDSEKRLVDIFVDNRNNRLVEVALHIKLDNLKVGVRVRLNEAFVIIAIDDCSFIGDEAYFDEWLDQDKSRLRVLDPVGDEKIIVFAAHSLPKDLDAGDAVRVYNGFAFEKTPKKEGSEYFLEEIPNVTFEDIGALDEQITTIKNELELPFLYPEKYEKYEIPLPKGILFYGSPGCGKTMLAKAIANRLNKRASELSGKKISRNFININGPELLNKYVGETERKIREIFKAAKKMASKEFPVVIFFDEIDSFFRARGIGISSDTESTIVPTLCSELDGLVELKNIIVIGATNRQDLIDPAVLRPGRFDIKMKIERPNEKGAEQIFRKKFKASYKLHEKYNNQPNALDFIINKALESIFSKKDEISYKDNEGREQIRDNKFVELTYINGEPKILYYADLILSGALIENIVVRAKKMAVRMEIEKKEPGLRARYLCAAVQQEYDENEDLPNTTNPDEWAKILGIKEKIVNIRFIRKEKKDARKIETINVGHYL
ncbi:MAG: proteasome ATPase [Candidatus Brennerbacteria bacterium]|nr:proteasome ATPase [Candidatus Brennerbacteria bacterium]